MACRVPPELDESQLIAAVEGDATAEVRAHLEQCPHCRARADELARLYAGLRAQLHRLDCPPADELSEFGFGLLPADRQATLQAHLDHCPRCRQELAQLSTYLDSLAADLELSLAERVKVLVARLVRGSEGPILGMAPAGVRGDNDGALIYEAGAVQIAIEMLPAADQPGRTELLGLVSGGDAAGLIVALLEGGRQIASAEVDPIGNFVLPGLAAGVYELSLRGPGLEIQIPELTIS